MEYRLAIMLRITMTTIHISRECMYFILSSCYRSN